MTEQLQQRLQNVEDLEAIRRLKADYCRYADDPEGAEKFAALFTEDATLDEGDDVLIVQGRSRLAHLHRVSWRYTRFNAHFVFSPSIDLDGDTATAHWRLLQMVTVAEPGRDEEAYLAAGWYDDRYQRVDGSWRIAEVVAGVHFCSPWADGWVKTPYGEFLSTDTLHRIKREVLGADDGV